MSSDRQWHAHDPLTTALVAPSSAEETRAAYAYCQQVTRRVARTFYYGSRFLSPQKRRAAWALYAFCRTADDIGDVPTEVPEPQRALDTLRAALVATYAGRPVGPLMVAWAAMLEHFAVPLAPALDLLDGIAMDLRGGEFATFDDLRLYCYRVAGTVGLLMAPVLGYRHEDALAHAVDLGIAMQLTNILRDIGEDAAMGRIYLPADEMAAFGYSSGALRRGEVNDAFRALMDHQIARAEAYYQRGHSGIPLLHEDAQFAIALSATLYRAILQRIRTAGYDVFSRRAHTGLATKLGAVPRTWLHLKRGAFNSGAAAAL